MRDLKKIDDEREAKEGIEKKAEEKNRVGYESGTKLARQYPVIHI